MATTKQISSVALGFTPRVCPVDAMTHVIIEDSFILGESAWSHKIINPVVVGNYVVDQADLLEVRERTGTLPKWMLTYNYTRSYLSVHEVKWMPAEQKEITDE